MIAYDIKTQIAYQCQRISLERWSCGKCQYGYITKEMHVCPNCNYDLVNDFMQSVRQVIGISPTWIEEIGLGRVPLRTIPLLTPSPPIWNLTKFSTKDAFNHIKQSAETEKYMTAQSKIKNQVYNIRIESPFILTQKQIKEKLGIGFHVVSVETERDLATKPIIDVDSAVEAMITTGYRALARANHPDLTGQDSTESETERLARADRMVLITKAKKELTDLLKEVKGI